MEAASLTAVLDSNVIISCFAFPQGRLANILHYTREGRIQAYISPFILVEVSRNWREKFGWEESRIEQALLFLNTYCTVIDPQPTLALEELSVEDNRVLDCAVDSKAQYLVTGDRGILSLQEYQGIHIITPRDFMNLIAS